MLMPGVVSHSTVIYACEKGTEWEGAVGLLQEMLGMFLQPELVVKLILKLVRT